MDEAWSCSEVITFPIEGREWHYQSFYDDKGRILAVRFYDDTGAFVTEFDNVDDMWKFLGHTDAKTVNEQLDEVRRFRVESEKFLAEWSGKNTVDIAMPEEEKEANLEVFQSRIRMLRGDMNSYEFGKVVGLGGGMLYGIFHNARNASTNVIKRIADRCNVSVDWLLGRI